MSYDRKKAKLANIDAQDIHIPATAYLNKIVQRIVEISAWFNVALIVLIMTAVILRYGFHRNGLALWWPLVPMEELQWHFYSVPVMLGLAYAITNDTHIRIDILRMRMSKRLKHIFEILGILLLLLPCVIILFDFGLDYTIYAITHHESSQSTMGLPHRWIIKSVIPLSMLLIIIASVARLIQEVVLLLYPYEIVSETSQKQIKREWAGGDLFRPQLRIPKRKLRYRGQAR
ncbi:MAG: TRAP transporter small permease subunit [Pelagibacteraceae bacterium]|jgi:TRAP-type mannitol/chloroaromatic compound transport system permease small subunit|nr:TRAP transporter small permease subunit [Pelagibacteraceae bacterium]|tara:strand:+ start:3763 stop:4455 length:693 start_codon:yes stop_codon:yes gene_type:complete